MLICDMLGHGPIVAGQGSRVTRLRFTGLTAVTGLTAALLKLRQGSLVTIARCWLIHRVLGLNGDFDGADALCEQMLAW